VAAELKALTAMLAKRKSAAAKPRVDPRLDAIAKVRQQLKDLEATQSNNPTPPPAPPMPTPAVTPEPVPAVAPAPTMPAPPPAPAPTVGPVSALSSTPVVDSTENAYLRTSLHQAHKFQANTP